MDGRKVGIEKLEDSKAYIDFISSLRSKSTKTLYSKGIKVFCQWYHKSIDEVLEMRKDDVTPRPSESIVEAKQRASRFEHELERFHNWLTRKTDEREAYLPSTATSMCKGLMQIFRYYQMPIALRTGSPISEGREYSETKRYPLSPDDVRRMYWKARDLKSKLWITMANDVPIRVGDFAKLLVKHLPNLNLEPPIVYEVKTEKEKTVAMTCLSADTVKLLKEYLELYKPQRWLWETKFNDELVHVDDSTLNRRLKELANECGIDPRPYSISWHCWRDYIYSIAKSENIDEDVANLLLGKKVESDKLAYMRSVKIRPAFMKIQQTTRINGELLVAKEVDMLTALGKQNAELMSRIESLEKELTQKFGYTQQQLSEIRDHMALGEEKFYLALREARDSEIESLKDRIENLENAVKSLRQRERGKDG